MNNLLEAAIVLATDAHREQVDKAGADYILHPISVMAICSSKDVEINCIALLHDVLEDSGYTVDDLYRAGMTTRIVDGVFALTKLKDERISDYYLRVAANPDAIKVKLADLTHNMNLDRLHTVTQKDIDRNTRYMKWYKFLEKQQ